MASMVLADGMPTVKDDSTRSRGSDVDSFTSTDNVTQINVEAAISENKNEEKPIQDNSEQEVINYLKFLC